MVMPDGATLISIGIGSSLFCYCLDESQDGSSRSAIRIFDLQRETDQFVCSRLHFSKVEALDEPDACLKQRMVGLDSVLKETTDREIINADGLHLLCCKKPPARYKRSPQQSHRFASTWVSSLF